MILEMTRGHIKLELDGRIVTIQCEALLPNHESPDFVVYENSIREWDFPHGEKIEDTERKKIIDQLSADMKAKNISIEVE